MEWREKLLLTIQKSMKTTMNNTVKNLFALMVVAFVTVSCAAQMKNVKSAQFAIDGEKRNSAQDILEGKGYIDVAYNDPKTSNNNRMWLFRAMVYSSVFNNKGNELLKNESAKSGYTSGYSLMQYFKSTEKKLAEDEETAAMECAVSFGAIFNESGELWQQLKYDELLDYYKIILFLYDKMVILDTATVNALAGQKVDRKFIITALASVAMKSSNATSKKEVFLSLISDGVALPILYEGLSTVYLEAGDTAEAERVIRKGIAAKPSDNSMFQLLVNFYKNTNRVQLLMTDLNKQIETNPESRLYYYRGVLYDEQKKGDLAMADYRKAVELDEFNYDACYNLGAAIKNYNVSDIYDQLAKSNITPARKKELKLKMVETYKEARKYLEVAATNQNYSVEDLTNLYEALVQCAIEQGDDEATKEFKDKLSALNSSAAK